MSVILFGQDLSQIPRRIGAALSYWGDAMRALLPKRVREQLTVGEEQIIVCQNDEQLQIYHNSLGKFSEPLDYTRQGDYFDSAAITEVKSILDNDHRLVLQVSDQVLLSKSVQFPAAVADDLRQALLYEMDKHTPFPPNEVYFDVVIMRQQANKVFARLYLLQKSLVQATLQQFADNGIRFDRLCTANEPHINLLPQVLHRRKRLFPLTRNVLLTVGLVLFFVLLLAVPLYFKRDTAIKLEQQIAQLAPQAAGEPELWQKRDEAEQVISEFIDNYPLPFAQIYEELSKRLPDNTWVSNLTYQMGKMEIRGEAADAAGLIALINASPLFYNAKIGSPIIKSRTADKEVYNIGFDVLGNTVVKE